MNGSGSKGCGEEGDVSLSNVNTYSNCNSLASREADLLIIVDLLQVVIEGIRKSGSDEIGLSIVGQTLLIELALKVLECQSIVQNGNIASRGRIEVHGNLTLLDWSSGNEASGHDGDDC